MSIFVLFVTNTQLFLDHQPSQPFRMILVFSTPPQPLQPGPEEGPLEGKKGMAVAPSMLPAPTHEPALAQFSATSRQQAGISLEAFVSGGSFSI